MSDVQPETYIGDQPVIIRHYVGLPPVRCTCTDGQHTVPQAVVPLQQPPDDHTP